MKLWKHIRLGIFLAFGVVAAGFVILLRGWMLEWPKRYEGSIFPAPDFSVSVVLADKWESLWRFNTAAYRAWDGADAWRDTASARPFVPASMLGRSVAREEIERMIRDCEATAAGGGGRFLTETATRLAADCRFLLSAEQAGDQYRAFHSPEWTWENLCGREGITLVRDGRAITGAVTGLN